MLNYYPWGKDFVKKADKFYQEEIKARKTGNTALAEVKRILKEQLLERSKPE